MTVAASLTEEALWTRARASFARTVDAIGAPAAIAAIAMLTREMRRLIVGHLCRLEHIVRKLLLAEAAALKRLPGWTAGLQARTCAVVAEKSAAGAARSNMEPVLDPAHPETWPAHFSFSLPHDPLAVPEARAPRIRALWGDTPAPTLASASVRSRLARDEADSALRLARRLEALRRVLDDPMPHALRLARLLARATRRFPEIVRRYLFAPARSDGYDRHDDRLSLDITTRAFDAPEAFCNSS